MRWTSPWRHFCSTWTKINLQAENFTKSKKDGSEVLAFCKRLKMRASQRDSSFGKNVYILIYNIGKM